MSNQWDASFYDEKHAYVSNYGSSLLDLLPTARKNKFLVDLGCGTGDLTQKIADLGFTVQGIDQSTDMISQAKKKYNSIDFQVRDIRKINFKEEVDVFFSNATFHWIKEIEELMTTIWRALKSKGEMVFELGAKGNIKIIIDAINKALDHFGFSQNKNYNPWRFLSLEELTNILKEEGFVIHYMDYFARPTKLEQEEKGLRNWLLMFANFFFKNIPHNILNKIIAFIEKETRPFLYKNHRWYADYKRLRVKARKW